jgi:hypothetical protein
MEDAMGEVWADGSKVPPVGEHLVEELCEPDTNETAKILCAGCEDLCRGFSMEPCKSCTVIPSSFRRAP